jgi:hypothetical protein
MQGEMRVRSAQLLLRHIVFFLNLYITIVSGIQEIDTVFLAYQTNLVNVTQIGNNLRYKAVSGSAGNVFRQVKGLDCDQQKEMLCWTDTLLKVVRYVYA